MNNEAINDNERFIKVYRDNNRNDARSGDPGLRRGLHQSLVHVASGLRGMRTQNVSYRMPCKRTH